jgi:leucyl/phenylalanyl-tRNA--protein transferase
MEPWRMRNIEALLGAYRSGFFPMSDNRRLGPLRWFNPDPRAIIPLTDEAGLHIPRRLADRVRSRRFEIATDRAFTDVMRGCAAPRPPPGEQDSWIDDRIIDAYTALHEAGHAHSIEAWLSHNGTPTLVGGLYGVHIGAAFFAESKFHRPDLGGTDASKVCLVHLIRHLRARGFELLDVQFWNPHIDQFGCTEIPREEYLVRLKAATPRELAWLPFDASRNG